MRSESIAAIASRVHNDKQLAARDCNSCSKSSSGGRRARCGCGRPAESIRSSAVAAQPRRLVLSMPIQRSLLLRLSKG